MSNETIYGCETQPKKRTKRLCIGGPWDGEKVAHPFSDESLYLCCAPPHRQKNAPLFSINPNLDESPKVEHEPIEKEEYKLAMFSDGHAGYEVWLFEGVCNPVSLLLTRYEKLAKAGKNE